MLGRKKASSPKETCIVPLGRADGPLCGQHIRGGAILVKDDGERNPLCHEHMAAFFRTLIIALEESERG